MSSVIVEVCKIEKVIPHPNADKLFLAQIACLLHYSHPEPCHAGVDCNLKVQVWVDKEALKQEIQEISGPNS